ncbi:MAG TPA: hypothetical protein VHM66_00220, partial [Solirubrobacterales bacterium]|nr:hypothetical protein [Solirubrobacterales bacterium]
MRVRILTTLDYAVVLGAWAYGEKRGHLPEHGCLCVVRSSSIHELPGEPHSSPPDERKSSEESAATAR